MDVGIVICVRHEHPSNKKFGIKSIEDGITICFNDVHSLKESPIISVIVEGIDIFVNVLLP